MKNAKIEVIIIDPFLKTIIKSEIENSLKSLQKAIGDHNIEIAYLEDNDIMYVDEEGLHRENQEHFLYKNKEGKVFPFSGKAVILGDKGDGENHSTESCVTDYLQKITFATVQEISAIISNQAMSY